MESHDLHCSKSQANILNRPHRRVACMLSRESSETGVGTITSGGQNGRRRLTNWISEKEFVRHSGRSKQLEV